MVDWLGGRSAICICALCYIWNLFGVLVCKRYMLNWRRGWGKSTMAFYYMWNWFCVWVCHGYMCIVYYVRLMGCNGVAWIYGQLAGGQSVIGICAYCCIWNIFSVMVFQTCMLNWRRGGGQCAMGMYALCYIWNLFGWMSGWPKDSV